MDQPVSVGDRVRYILDSTHWEVINVYRNPATNWEWKADLWMHGQPRWDTLYQGPVGVNAHSDIWRIDMFGNPI